MVCRFGEGTHVYLVGSYLVSETPRDLDISIVVPDNLFWRRYRDAADVERLSEISRLRAEAPEEPSAQGDRDLLTHPKPDPVEDWNVHGEWTPDMLRFGREWANLTRNFFWAWSHLGGAGGAWPVDLKIMPESEADARHKHGLRIQIDTIPVFPKSAHATPAPTAPASSAEPT